MSANLENSVVAMGLEDVSFHFNPKEGQSQRIDKLSVLNLLMHVFANFFCKDSDSIY